MTKTERTTLVTGPTGKQGGAVIKHMLGRGWCLRALTRDPESRAARLLVEKMLRSCAETWKILDPSKPPYGASAARAGFLVCRRETRGTAAKNLADAASKEASNTWSPTLSVAPSG